MADVWYIARAGEAHGPITSAEFAEFIKRGHLLETDYVWHDGLVGWLLGEDLLSADNPLQSQQTQHVFGSIPQR